MQGRLRRSMVDYKAQGKKNRLAGAAFERKTRLALTTEGWTVSKWQNNIDLDKGFMHAARRNRFASLSTGFPDFVAFRRIINPFGAGFYRTIFVECKVNGKLTKTEKAKMQFLEDRGFECWIARNEKGKVAYRKYLEYIKSHRICGEEAEYQIR